MAAAACERSTLRFLLCLMVAMFGLSTLLLGCQNTPDSPMGAESPMGADAREDRAASKRRQSAERDGKRKVRSGRFGNHASPLRLAEIEAIRERLRREREANPNADLPRVDDEDAECAHVWQQVGSHPWRKPGMNGIPMMAMCAISRCTKCGKLRHECQQKRRRRR